MGRYGDATEFLAAHEGTNESRMNRRTTLTAAEAKELCQNHQSIPDDYIDYLTEIGWDRSANLNTWSTAD